MTRPLALCILFATAAVCRGDDGATQFGNATDNGNRDGVFAEASPAELEQLSKMDEPTRRLLSKYLSKEIDKHETRIAQLEDELASRSNSSRQPLYATPTPVSTPSPFAALPSPRRPAQTQAKIASPHPSPYRPANTWQRVNLHGNWFYIVPVEHVDAFAPPQPK